MRNIQASDKLYTRGGLLTTNKRACASARNPAWENLVQYNNKIFKHSLFAFLNPSGVLSAIAKS